MVFDFLRNFYLLELVVELLLRVFLELLEVGHRWGFLIFGVLLFIVKLLTILLFSLDTLSLLVLLEGRNLLAVVLLELFHSFGHVVFTVDRAFLSGLDLSLPVLTTSTSLGLASDNVLLSKGDGGAEPLENLSKRG